VQSDVVKQVWHAPDAARRHEAVVMPVFRCGVQVQSDVLVRSAGAVLRCALLMRIFDGEADVRGGQQGGQQHVGE
jgi:hypothetical protein